MRGVSRNLRLSRARRRAIILISRVTPVTQYAKGAKTDGELQRGGMQLRVWSW